MVDTTFKWEKSNKIIRVSKPDFLPKIKDFEIIFVNLCSILSFSKQNTYLSRKEVGKKQNFYFEKKKSFGSDTNTETGLCHSSRYCRLGGWCRNLISTTLTWACKALREAQWAGQ